MTTIESNGEAGMKLDVRMAWFAAMLAIAALATACGADLPDVSCDGTVPAYSEVAALAKCSTCHSSKVSGAERKGAPAGLNFDTQAAAEAKAEDASSEVNEGAMPPASSGIKLTDAEKQELYKWALCR